MLVNKGAYRSIAAGLDYKSWFAATEQRLDAYQWRFIDDLKPIAYLEKAVNSNKKSWAKIQSKFRSVADRAILIDEKKSNQIRGVPGKELSQLKSDIAKFAREGQQLVNKILLGEFPHYK